MPTPVVPFSPGPSGGSGWLVPDWPAPAHVHAVCTSRVGGVSAPPYDSLNLGMHVGDEPVAVQANRQRLADAMRARTPGAHPVFLNQVHGSQVLHLDGATPDGRDADACVATAPGPVCTIMVADCLPVLLAHRSGAVVGAAHAGWRGLAGSGGCGVLEAVFERFSALALMDKAQSAIETEASSQRVSAVAGDTLAWLGPCIGPQAFEVGAEVRDAFCAHDPAAHLCFSPHGDRNGKYLCDLAGLARLRLQALGVSHIHGNDGTPDWCTVHNASRFFSHRRDSSRLGGSGRFAACIWLG